MLGLPAGVKALLFDLDGVLTDTARVHAAAWKQMFDAYLRQRAVRTGEPFVPFDVGTDYQQYVDGKPRYDGVRSFLASRGITLPEGDKSDPPERRDGRRPGQPQERPGPAADPRRRGRGLPGFGALPPRRPRRRTCPRRSSRRAATPATPSPPPASPTCSTPGSTAITAEQAAPEGQARAGHVPGRRPGPRRRPGGRGGVRGRPGRRGGGRGRRLRRRGRVSTASATATPTTSAATGRHGSSPTWPSSSTWTSSPQPTAVGRRHRSRAAAPQRPQSRQPAAAMIENGNFPVEPWAVRETRLDLKVLAQSESLFALANGHLGLRGNLEEGDPHGLPGTYLNGLFESRPLPYAEAGYGYPEAGQTVINVTNGKIIRMLVDDEPFDVRYGSLRSHERVLDLRAGVLRRNVEWVSPAGQAIRVRTTRLVSFVQRSVAAMLYEVEPLDDPASLVVQSELVANEVLPTPPSSDPRAAAALTNPLQSDSFFNEGATGGPGAQHPGQPPADGGGDGPHRSRGRRRCRSTSSTRADLGRVTVAADLQPGQRLRLVKFLAYGWSSRRTTSSVRDQVEAALSGATHAGWDRLVASQRRYLDEFWDRADVELDGDSELQQAVRFALFHILQAGARAERRAIAAKGLTGPGYDGHAFWDTESFVLPGAHLHRPPRRRRRAAVAAPHARPGPGPGDPARPEGRRLPVADDPGRGVLRLLAGRHRRLPHRRRHRRRPSSATRRPPATTPSSGRSASRSWSRRPACGAPSATTTPRAASASTGSPAPTSTAPSATTTCTRTSWPSGTWWRRPTPWPAARTGPSASASTRRRRPAWRDAARAVVVPYDETLGVHAQAEGFTDHEVWDFDAHPARQVPPAAALPLLRPLPQAGRQAGRPGHGPLHPGRRLHRRGEGPGLRVLRGASPSVTRRCRRASRRWWRPRSGTSSWPTTTSARPG